MTGVVLRIDRDACLGTGLCAALSPELFALDDDGIARPAAHPGADPGLAETARSAAECCPNGAITVVTPPADPSRPTLVKEEQR